MQGQNTHAAWHESFCGLSGVLVELLCDVAFRIVLLSPRDAVKILRDIKGFPLSLATVGPPFANLEALQRLLLLLSELAVSTPEIKEIDSTRCMPTARGR